MNRNRQLQRAHARLLGIGLAVSLVAHAAALVLVRFRTVPLRPDGVRVVQVQESETSWRERAVRLVVLEPPDARARPREAVLPFPDAGGAASASGGGSAAPAPEAVSGARLLPASEAQGPGFERLLVLDPRSNTQAQPVVFSDLPAAETTAATQPADADQPYVPGSIGKAKRQWAADGDGQDQTGTGRGRFVLVPGGGGHCPIPARPGRGPLWAEA